MTKKIVIEHLCQEYNAIKNKMYRFKTICKTTKQLNLELNNIAEQLTGLGVTEEQLFNLNVHGTL